MIHDNETWPMKEEHDVKLGRIEATMLRWICGFKLKERKRNAKIIKFQ